MRAMPERAEDTPRQRHFGFVPGLQLWRLPDLVMGRVWARTLHATVSVNRDDYPPRLVSEFGFRPERLLTIYNGVPLPASVPGTDDRRFARETLGLPSDSFVIGYVGRVSAEKGLKYAVEGLASARARARMHLLVAGDGDDLASARAAATVAGVADRVHFLGYVSDPSRVYAAADIAVVPSLWNEAFGRVVVEAMGRALPVVATTVGGMRELFEDGEQGLFVPKADTAALAAAFDRLAADEAPRRRMAAAARELALARYSTQRVAAEYARLYESLSHA
jgi:glycosyltransferase involved in cell wall biosynthesis